MQKTRLHKNWILKLTFCAKPVRTEYHSGYLVYTWVESCLKSAKKRNNGLKTAGTSAARAGEVRTKYHFRRRQCDPLVFGEGAKIEHLAGFWKFYARIPETARRL